MLKDKRTSFKKRVVRLYYPFFVLHCAIISLALPATTSAAEITNHTPSANLFSEQLSEIRSVAATGAASLALQLINQHQENLNLTTELNAWLDWERERISIYQLGKRWEVLQQRVASYDENLPIRFLYWAKQQQIEALLTLNKGQQARQIIQKLIWSENKDPELLQQWLPRWQKNLIESYLVDNETSDALLAAQRYYQDYGSNDIEDRLLRARILLINQREEEVVELLLKDTRHPQGGMLYLLAQLRSGERPPRKVLQSALRQMRGKWAGSGLKYMLWAVVAESAKRSNDYPSTVNALEFVLAGHKNIELPAGLFDFSADRLWEAYSNYALYIGNKAQYLIGDDKQWLDAAHAAEAKYPVKARSLYALIIHRGQDATARIKAANGFLKLMHKRKRGAELVMRLFLKSKYFKDIESIPAPVRYDLVDVALSRSDIELASTLMTTIKTPPKGSDNYQWQLRRARIFILGGKAAEGSKTLQRIIETTGKFNREQLDKFLQVVFDLQTAKEHEYAFQLFRLISAKVTEKELQREIFYWMADSLKAQEKFSEAAQLYLRSAYYLLEGLDPWGQTARYQAAEMLAKADLLQDAHSLYENLLRTTKEPARRAVLKHELQKLWLLRNESKFSEENKLTDEDDTENNSEANLAQ